ncbi:MULTISPECIES: Fic family protein [unclassified Spirosoma]|uniref:Fic family protein n=1 Tax=unclassified Spirosoma TaxID=2621999 RepID=UPI00095921D1|nr:MULTISPECIES: Fic family protein [unclassified Spirosoma]MBN8824733.1 Fic family protein [Spirosoma sp.]OJW78724.1 MAG: cell filamentation protein Fic [Spirosoma sp. 48-14]
MYIYQRREWPQFRWDQAELIIPLAALRHKQGKLIGQMTGLGFSLQSEAMLQTMTLEVLKSNEIEGEILDQHLVRSSIARRLGIDTFGLLPPDRQVEGVVDVLVDATQYFSQPLTKERLCSWHAALFPTGYSGMHKITVADWRSGDAGPMQVVSGAIGREQVHFQAPDASILDREMQLFLTWFNGEFTLDPVLKAAVAHLWFVTIHPFDDGNGRLGRTIADMQLARADGLKQRFYSMSAQIRKERTTYYTMLEKTQKGALDITDWLSWFLACLDRALSATENILAGVLTKARYWEWLSEKMLNARQQLMLNKLLDGFEGKLTTSKWAKITKTSQDTALRDIQNLLDQEILVKEDSGGRSTNYALRTI